jgi:hypothetical protein
VIFVDTRERFDGSDASFVDTRKHCDGSDTIADSADERIHRTESKPEPIPTIVRSDFETSNTPKRTRIPQVAFDGQCTSDFGAVFEAMFVSTDPPSSNCGVLQK